MLWGPLQVPDNFGAPADFVAIGSCRAEASDGLGPILLLSVCLRYLAEPIFSDTASAADVLGRTSCLSGRGASLHPGGRCRSARPRATVFTWPPLKVLDLRVATSLSPPFGWFRRFKARQGGKGCPSAGPVPGEGAALPASRACGDRIDRAHSAKPGFTEPALLSRFFDRLHRLAGLAETGLIGLTPQSRSLPNPPCRAGSSIASTV